MAPRFVATQLANPRGLGGAAIRFLMNRRNAKMNAYAVEQLAVEASDRVLEIGFGGGAALPGLLGGAANVCGVDRSSDVVVWAGRRFSDAVRSGTADFRVGSVEDLPARPHAFDKALSVNTVYFWSSLDVGTREIARVLSPGGRVVLGFVPKSQMDRMHMPSDIFTPRDPESVTEALRAAGFTDVELRRPAGEQFWVVATGLRSG